jgi:hypothetical protein
MFILDVILLRRIGILSQTSQHGADYVDSLELRYAGRLLYVFYSVDGIQNATGLGNRPIDARWQGHGRLISLPAIFTALQLRVFGTPRGGFLRMPA